MRVYTSSRIFLFLFLLLQGAITVPAQEPLLPIKNVHQVSETLYRSGQPRRKGFAALETAGFTDVINLRTIWSDRCRSGKAKIQLHHIHVVTSRMSEADLVAIFRQIERSQGKVLIHCWHGSDYGHGSGPVPDPVSGMGQRKSHIRDDTRRIWLS